MKRALWLLPVPLAAIVVAVLAQRAPEPQAQAPAANETAEPAPVTTGPTWVATKTPPRSPHLAVAQPSPKETTGLKPMTASREALMDSHVPVVATLSVDQLGSPRERLLAAHGTGEARQAQLDRLSDRTAAHLEKLRTERAQATGEERARLTRTIENLERNQSMRRRVMGTTVHVAARPGTSAVGWDIPAKRATPQQ